MDIQRLISRQSEMETARSNWETLWEAVARMVLPRADNFRQKHANGTQRTQRQYDAFPMAALDKFAAGLEGGLIPRATYWHRLTTGDEELDDVHEVQVYLDELNKLLWETRYSPRANFAGQAHESLMSIGAFGTGVMLIEARAGGGIKYRNHHLGEIYLAENYEGMVDTIHRKFMLTARQAVQTFGDKTPKRVIDKFTSGKLDQKFEFLHCVFPRDDFDPERLDQKGMPYVGYYAFPDSKEIVDETGFHELPYVAPRYTLSSREIYGRGPAVLLLPDIAMLNEMQRTTIEAANMSVDPPVLAHEDISEIDLSPGATNMGALDDNGRELLRPFNPQTRVDIGLEMISKVKNQIDDAFLGVYFRVLLDNPNMTATQAMLIAQQHGQMTAPAVGRLQSEWLGPMIRRESAILHRQGRHPVMPDVLKERLGEEGLRIEYQSPLTRAAQSEEAVGILRTFETLAPIAQIDPSVYDEFDAHNIAKIVAKVNGVPAKAMKTKEAMDALKAQKDQQAQLGQVLQAAPIAAQTAKTIAQTQALSQNAPRPVGG